MQVRLRCWLLRRCLLRHWLLRAECSSKVCIQVFTCHFVVERIQI